jgi:uncharacterized protein YjiS (DUF1127 family)
MQRLASLLLPSTGRLEVPGLQAFALWRSRMRRREELFLLSRKGAHILEDVGLTPEFVAAEIRKPFWRA